MAHLENYKSFNGDAKRIINEVFRENTDNEKYSHIDRSRSCNNYVLENTADGFVEFDICIKGRNKAVKQYEKRLAELQSSNTTKTGKPRQIRYDANTLSVWVVTCPRELFENTPKDEWDANPDITGFFKETFKFMVQRYGAKNVICATVHNDETSPHAHFLIVPEKEGRLSAKALFNRQELIHFHNDLDLVMEKRFGQKGLVKNGRTKGNYTVEELRERTKQENDLRNRKIQFNKDFKNAKEWLERQKQKKVKFDNEALEFKAKRKKHEETMINESQQMANDRSTLKEQINGLSALHYELAKAIDRAVKLLEEIEDVKKRELYEKELEDIQQLAARFSDNIVLATGNSANVEKELERE